MTAPCFLLKTTTLLPGRGLSGLMTVSTFKSLLSFCSTHTLPETNMFASEDQWLEYSLSFGMAYFEGQTVSFGEGINTDNWDNH